MSSLYHQIIITEGLMKSKDHPKIVVN